MIKKIFSFALMLGIFGLMILSTLRADTFLLDSSIASPYFSSVHFKYGGNDFGGILLINGTIDIASGQTISLAGNPDKLCYKQMKGYYFNPQRGNRWRPLDSASATLLQGSGNLIMTGGLFTNCSGENPLNTYGQLTHIYNGTSYKLLAGVDYLFGNNSYTGSYSGSLLFHRVQNAFAVNGYLRDINGGIGFLRSNVMLYQGITSLTGTVASGSVFVPSHPNIFVYSSGYTGYLQFSGVAIVVSGADRNGFIVPPTLVTTQPGMAARGETGITMTGTVLMTIQAGATGTRLVASGGNFLVSFVVLSGNVNQIFAIYRSEDGNVWTGNKPQLFCTLDANKNCSFLTDHLTYFALLTTSSDGIRTVLGNGQTCGDIDGCVCNGSNINSGQLCDFASSQTQGGGGSYTLKMDDCKRGSSKNNLPGANEEGIDYSPSYYDRTCVGPLVSGKKEETLLLGSIKNSPYSYDLNQAYLYAYANKLTLAKTIQEAGMKDTLKRKDLAIMIAGYAMRVLGLTPDAKKKGCDKFVDTKKLDGNTQLYIMWSCQLGLMGVDTHGNVLSKFRPNELVTRAHFATIFSRLLFGDRYDGGKPYYQKHIAGLATHGIIKSEQNPKMKERRGYVMLMMMRADKKDVGRMKYRLSAAENGALALLDE